MIVSLVGHRGYVGQNIKESLSSLDNLTLLLIDRNTSNNEMIDFIKRSDVLIHCAAIQKPDVNEIDSFMPNYILTQKIVDNLPDQTRLIFVSTIHYSSDTPFGKVRRMEEDYIVENLNYYTIYHLPYTFGPYGKPDYNNVFNTYILNIIRNKSITINEFNAQFPLISIRDFAKKLVFNINKSLFFVNFFEVINTTLIDYLHCLSEIRKNKIFKSKYMLELKTVYEWYRDL